MRFFSAGLQKYEKQFRMGTWQIYSSPCSKKGYMAAFFPILFKLSFNGLI
jgi:hypothetical protein